MSTKQIKRTDPLEFNLDGINQNIVGRWDMFLSANVSQKYLSQGTKLHH